MTRGTVLLCTLCAAAIDRVCPRFGFHDIRFVRAEREYDSCVQWEPLNR